MKCIENGKIVPEDGAFLMILGIVLPFQGVLLSLALLVQEKKMVSLRTLLKMFLFPVKNMFI